MTTDEGLLFGLDDPDFANRYPELAPLAPVAVPVQMLVVHGPYAEKVRQAGRWIRVVGDMTDAEPGREVEWIDYAALRQFDWAKQLRACVHRLKEYGFEVNHQVGDITFRNGERGPNPSVVTLAACLVLDAMDLAPTDEVNNEVGEAVAERLRRAFMIPDLDGTDESFKKTLRRHLVDPTRYRLAQRRR